ncbi:MAG: glycosyltransferase family 2 protein [Brevinematales bacterium]|nr:glycosyltransferase family 2 protein [Brevinematales bacterium]
MDYLLLFFELVLFINLFFLFVSISNFLFLKKSSFFRKPSSFPKISVLIPARNEEKNIERCINSLLSIDYPNYEIIVLNDNSFDKTEEILKKYEKFDNFKYYNGKNLPSDWKGKPFACEQLLKYADGEICFFTDADTIHKKDTLSFLVGKMEEYNVDFISGFALQRALSFGERMIIPALYLISAIFLPLFLIPKVKNYFISFAIGQIIFVKKDKLLQIGGFQSVKDEVVEDIALAREIKRHGFKSIFLDLKDYVECRMYDGFRSGFKGISRVIFPAIGKNYLLLFSLIVFVFSSIIYPFFYFLLNDKSVYSTLALYSILIFFLSWLITLSERKLGFIPVILYPLFFINLIVMALYSAFKIGIGKGVVWKERFVK